MSKGFDHVVGSLEARFDYMSARVIARGALAAAGLKEQDKYSDAELAQIANGIVAEDAGDGRVWAALGAAPAGTPVPAAKAAPEAPKKEEAKKEEPKKEEARKEEPKKEEAKKEEPKKEEPKKDGPKKGGKKK